MNVYVWKRVKQCTENWHPEGGVMAVADTEARARELALAEGCKISVDETPTRVIGCDFSEVEYVCLFPDAGCC